MRYITTVDNKEYLVEILDEKHIIINGKTYEVDFESVSGQPVYSLIVDGKSHESYVQQGDDKVHRGGRFSRPALLVAEDDDMGLLSRQRAVLGFNLARFRYWP